MAAAYRLHEKGVEVELYEARSRLGGRVLTVSIAGHLAEIGAQNIYDGGAAENCLKLAQDLGLEIDTEIYPPAKMRFFQAGEFLDARALMKERSFSAHAVRETLETLKESRENMQEIVEALFAEGDFLRKFCQLQLAAYEGASCNLLSTFYIDTLYHILLGGLSSAHQSKEDEPFRIEHAMVRGGNSLIAERVAQRLEDRLFLNHVLTAIGKREGKYELTFANGKRVVTDCLVLAFPASVYADIAIDPSVIAPDRKLQIESIVYGSSAKILVPIHKAGPACMNDRAVAFMNRDDHVINLYYVLDYGRFDESDVKEVLEKDLPMLVSAYEVSPSLDVQLSKDEAFAEYSAACGHSWPLDPFARGSYSCIGAGQEALLTETAEILGEPVRTLFAPIEGRLFFAGEHCSVLFDVGGTMEAACESGERCARQILRQFPS